MNWKRMVCTFGLVLWCASAVMAGPVPTTNQQEAVTADNTQAVNPAAQSSATLDVANTTADMRGQTTLTAFAERSAVTGGSTVSAVSRGGDPVIWNNGGGGGQISSSQLALNYPFNSQFADDFEFAADMIITYVEWGGGYWNPDGSAPDDVNEIIHIIFYNDDGSGTQPTGAGLDDPTVTAIADFAIPMSSVTYVEQTEPDWYDFEVALPGGFQTSLATTDKIWVAIQSERGFPPQYGTQSSTDIWGANGVTGFPALGTAYWEVGVDMAFLFRGVFDGPIPQGACCDPCTGNCTYELVTNCLDPLVFTEGVLCEDLDPPCAIIDGACCIDFVCDDTLCEFDCLALEGVWIEGETCPDYACPENPCVTGGASPCPWDLNGTGSVDPVDVGIVKQNYGCPVGTGDPVCDACDLSGNGSVDPVDVGVVKQNYGPCPAGTEVIYDNGADDRIDPASLSAERRLDDSLERWVADDVFFAAAVTVQDLHWWVAEEAGAAWNGTDDFIILLADGPLGGPGTVVMEAWDVPNFRIPTGRFVGGRQIFVYGIDGLDIPLVAGEYWFGMRPVQPTGGGQFFWAKAPDNGTDNVWVLYETNDDWVPGYQVFDEDYQNVAFCVTGVTTGTEETGACCDDWDDADCTDGVLFSDCPAGNRFAADTLCVDLVPECGDAMGVCCDGMICLDAQTANQCYLQGLPWYADVECGTFDCPGGACCYYDPDECIQMLGYLQEYDCVDAGGAYYDGERCVGTEWECPVNPCTDTGIGGITLYAQLDNGTTAATCDADPGYDCQENFPQSGQIEDLHWFGIGHFHDGAAWQDCDNWDTTFEVIFYGMDAGGGIDLNNILCGPYTFDSSLGEVTRLDTGNDFGGSTVYRYDVLIDPICDMWDGWVGIQAIDVGDDCWFLWVSSTDGDLYSLQNGGANDYDFSLCLTGHYEPAYGACCDDATTDCTDGVERQDCPEGFRHTVDVLCADLDPACGDATGACCLPDGTCEQAATEAECAGDWLGLLTPCELCPCLVPCPEGASQEGEPECGDWYEDVTNGGCISEPPVFTTISEAGEVFCGKGGNYQGAVPCEVDQDCVDLGLPEGTVCLPEGRCEGYYYPSRDTDWYELTLTAPKQITWSVNAEFDTQIFVMDAGAGDCSDYEILFDADGLECTDVAITTTLEIGTYYLFVSTLEFEGFPCDADYVATLTVDDPCDVVCVGTAENEPGCGEGYEDTFNAGCFMDEGTEAFSAIAIDETVCGTSGTWQTEVECVTDQDCIDEFGEPDAVCTEDLICSYVWTSRDTDWYSVTTAVPMYLTLTGEAEFPLSLGFAEKVPPGDPDCLAYTGYLTPYVEGGECEEVSITTAWLPPGTYYFVVMPSDFTGAECGDEYEITLTSSDNVGPIHNNWYFEMPLVDEPGGLGDGVPRYWYIYETSGWINVWFYDDPYDPARYKEITIVVDVAQFEPGLSTLEFAVNWSTAEWSTTGNPPGEPRVPPIEDEDDIAGYIARETFINVVDVTLPPYETPDHLTFTWIIPDFNPEWVSIDVRGVNFIVDGWAYEAVPDLGIYHECLELP